MWEHPGNFDIRLVKHNRTIFVSAKNPAFIHHFFRNNRLKWFFPANLQDF